MAQVVVKFTVLFEDPFWRGIYECERNGIYEIAKVTFGAEPKVCEVYEFILKNWDRLSQGTSKEKLDKKDTVTKSINPKRMQRAVKKQLQEKGIGTKAQQALKEQQEQGKLQRKVKSKKQKEAEKILKFELKQDKKKQKHRGH